MDEYLQVLEYIKNGYYTIQDLMLKFEQFTNKDEFTETLDGFALFGKIKKTRQYYHGIEIKVPEKKKIGNSLDCTNVDYPDWVKTDRDKVKFLTSPESPKLLRGMHFFVDDIQTKNTGRLIYDSLNSNHIMTSYFLSPDNTNGGNKINYSKDVTQHRGFSILIRDGKIKINVSLLKPLREKYANTTSENEVVADHFEQTFNTYEEFVEWLKKNL